jgi:uncharacterized membrane protein YphA (DoxX/SURF4 family)
MPSPSITNAAALLGPLAPFCRTGAGKIRGHEATSAAMAKVGVLPGMLLPLAIIVELLGGMAQGASQ